MRPSEPLSVLLAEDDLVNAEIAKAFLRNGGHRVVLAMDGAQAVDLAGQGGFDLILMDMLMPRMDGLEAARRIRALPAPSGLVPIVALTAHGRPADVERCMAAGMNAHLTKPIRHSALFETIARLLPGRAGRGACYDVLLPGDGHDGTEARLRELGHRVFAVPRDAAALAMLKARPFDLVAIPGATTQRVAVFRAAADVRGGKTRILAIAHGLSCDELRVAGADGVMLAGDTLAAAIEATVRGVANETVEQVVGPQRLAQLRRILIQSVRDQLALLSDPYLPAAQLAAIAHRLKGSAANLGLSELAAAADAAQAAADNPTQGEASTRTEVQRGLYDALRRVILTPTDPAPLQE